MEVTSSFVYTQFNAVLTYALHIAECSDDSFTHKCSCTMALYMGKQSSHPAYGYTLYE